FRHEQNAGYAAAITGFLTKTPGICLTVSAPGFLNGLTALAHATTNCFPMILISGSSEREIVDLQQGDYEEMDQLAVAKPLCKAAYRVLHATDIGIGVARAIRAAVSGRPGGVYLDLPGKLFGQVMDAAAGHRSLGKMIGARLNWLLSHGKGRQWGMPGSKKFIHVDIEPREMDSNVEIAAPLVGDIGSCVAALLSGMGNDWKQPPAEWTRAIADKKESN